MKNITQQLRYGEMVWESDYDKNRKEQCLCLCCNKMKPGTTEHCKLAAEFYEICKKGGNAFIMTRCRDWGNE